MPSPKPVLEVPIPGTHDSGPYPPGTVVTGGCRLLGCDTPYVKQTADQPIALYGESEEVTKLLLSLAADATLRTGSEWVIDGEAVLGPVVPLPEE